jgi:hypothetical protein
MFLQCTPYCHTWRAYRVPSDRRHVPGQSNASRSTLQFADRGNQDGSDQRDNFGAELQTPGACGGIQGSSVCRAACWRFEVPSTGAAIGLVGDSPGRYFRGCVSAAVPGHFESHSGPPHHAEGQVPSSEAPDTPARQPERGLSLSQPVRAGKR